MTMLTYTKTNSCVAVSADNFCARYDAACGSISKWQQCDQEFTALAAGWRQACRVVHHPVPEAGGKIIIKIEDSEARRNNVRVHCPHKSFGGSGGFCYNAGTANIVVFLVDRNGVMSLENK